MTTPVGSIRLDLKIDGSALSRLRGQIRESLAPLGPITAEATRHLDKLERKFNSVGREAESSSAKQSASAKVSARAIESTTRAADRQAAAMGVLSKAVDTLGDNYRQAAASGELFKAAQPSVRSLNSQARAVDRLALSYTKLAAAQSAAAAAPQPSGPPPNRGGGGGGGGGSRRGGGGIGGFLTSPIGLNGIALGASALPAATLAVTNLVGAVQQLGQAGLVLPGVFAGAASSIGVAVLGFKGMGDAIKALNEGDIDKAAKAMKDMDPAAQAVAKSVSKFTQGPLKDLRKNLQANMFDGIADGFDGLIEKRMPNLTKGLGGIGQAWNQTFKQILSTAGSDSTGGILDRIFGNTAEGQKRANAAIDPLVKGMGTLAAAGSDVLPRLGDALGRVATRFSNFITTADGDGRLSKWIDDGLTGVTNLGNTFLNLGKSIASITKAAGGDGGLLKLMETGSKKLSDFLGSADGQQRLTAFFADARQRLSEWLPILGNVAKIVGDVFKGIQQWGDTILPVVSNITSSLTRMPDAVTAVATAFVAWKSISGITSLIGKLTNLGGLLDGLPGRAQRSAGGIGGAFGGRGGGLALGGGLLLGGLTTESTSDSSTGKGLGALTTIGGSTLLGAEIGSIIPGVGTAIGAAVGAFSGGIIAAVPAIVQSFKDEAARRDQFNQFITDNQKNQAPALVAPVPGAPGVPAGTPLTPIAPRADQITPTIPAPPGGFRNLPGLNPLGVDTSIGRINAIDEQVAKTKDDLKGLGIAIEGLPTGEIQIKNPSPQVLADLDRINIKVRTLEPGKVVVDVDTSAATSKMQRFIQQWSNAVISPKVAVPGQSVPGQNPLLAPFGRADGGILPGFSPGIDNMLWPMSGGEGVVIPEAMRALGPGWLYGLNSRFRSGLSRRGYGFADGGVVPGADALSTGGSPVIDLLTQIRDALIGRTGGPLSDLAAASTTSGGGGAASTNALPWGGDPGKGALAGLISWAGLDPAKFIPGFNSSGQPLLPLGGGVPGAPGNVSGIAAALAKFATSGNTADLAGSGLGPGDSVVSAIVTARNKKKNGLSDQEISDLVTQVLGGGYSGVLDDRNSSLVKSLTTYRNKLFKAGGATTSVPAADPLGLVGAGGGTGVGANALIAFAQAANGAKYGPASDLANGLADCSGAVSDLVELITKGSTSPERLFTTTNAGQVLQSLGAVPGLIPGALQIGINPQHMAATLPNGVNFESGGSGGGVVYGGSAAGAADSQFTEQWSLPIGKMTDALGSMAGDMCGCVGDSFGGGLKQFAGDMINGVGGVAGNVGGDIAKGLFGGGNTYTPSGPDADPTSLFREGNLAALATLIGLKVPDLSRAGGGAGAQNLMVNPGPGFDAQGRMMSDTTLLIDRTMTSFQTVMEAKFQQMQDVLNQIRDQLADIASKLVTALSQSAASVASSAIPGSADGRVFPGYAPGVDSMIARYSPGEGVLIPEAVRALGGAAGIYAINSRYRRGLSKANYPGVGGGMPRFASGGVVNDNVGADFFGLSQIPIIGGIVNMLISIFLRILGIQIEQRDTLHDMTKNIREFRGDFARFDASGRLASDSSGLVGRNQSGRDIVNAERIRILTQVVVGVIKYVIEKVIMPLIQTAIQSAINFGTQAISSAVGGAASVFAPGSGGVASGLANAAVGAIGNLANTGSQIFTDFLGSFLTNGLSVLTEGIASLLPNMIGGLFDIPGVFQALFGGVASLIGGLFGGLGGFFDSGGLATGTGMMPKNTIKPERVLDPQQTIAFEEAMSRVGRGGRGSNAPYSKTELHVAQHFYGGGRDTGEAAANRLGALIA